MLTVGSLVPDFSLTDSAGQATALSAALTRGPVLLFFAKSGCGATDLAAPVVERLWAGFAEHVSPENTRLTVLGVIQEAPAETGSFGSRHGLTFPLLSDAELSVSRSVDLDSTPTVLLLRGTERLRADAATVAPESAYRVVDVAEGWSREAYTLLSEEIAGRIGTLPVELTDLDASMPLFRPG